MNLKINSAISEFHNAMTNYGDLQTVDQQITTYLNFLSFYEIPRSVEVDQYLISLLVNIYDDCETYKCFDSIYYYSSNRFSSSIKHLLFDTNDDSSLIGSTTTTKEEQRKLAFLLAMTRVIINRTAIDRLSSDLNFDIEIFQILQENDL